VSAPASDVGDATVARSLATIGAARPRVERVRGLAIFVAIGLVFLFVLPAVMSDFRLGLLSKYLCFAIVAIGIDLAWGYGGMLTLGQGVFFGLGAYAMGMYMKLHEAGPGAVPDFMSWSGVEKLPALWVPFRSPVFALAAAIILPVAAAALLGILVFRRRVRGAYFAILSQALAAAFVILLIGQQGLTGGTNGLTNFHELFGYNLDDASTQHKLYLVVVVVLGVVYLLARQLVASRYGRLLIAVRDGEDRVRFLGYNPTVVKVVAFSVSAGMAGIAGALFVPIVGIISPAQLGIVACIEMVIWVGLGGRATLVGAIVGAIAVNSAKTGLSEQFPSAWTYLQGLLFVLVVAFAPRGLAGVKDLPTMLRQHRRAQGADDARGAIVQEGEAA
jgi:urea transport system permease protein